KCMTCGVCLEVCPNVTQNNKFVGAQAISQVRLFDLHPTKCMTCGVCLEVCPNVTQNNKFVGAQAISQVRL
ncbi:4Fe-4S dicluster domain-containing protein, partial [Staphylococcus aureus]|uniref:4Fe-4S dicluster domain-containing protein n=1 Tax=Staphylococcus aureus TaxID=1280 RepID=UPI00115C7A78